VQRRAGRMPVNDESASALVEHGGYPDAAPQYKCYCSRAPTLIRAAQFNMSGL
jgi:hypothetical protein